MGIQSTVGAGEVAARRPATANWFRSPKQVWLRRALFQIHLWVGVALAAYAVVIGLTGSALVFREETERAVWPALQQIEPVTPRMTLDEAVRAIEKARPGWRAFALKDFSQPRHSTTVLMRWVSGPVTPNYREVSFNPYTGEVMRDRLRYAGFLGWMGNLHVYLMAGQAGLTISGFMALGLLVLCVTGVVLWWPGVARWTAALAVNPKARWKRLNWELHSVVGFWSCAALLVVTITGLDFAFPDQVGKLVEIVVMGNSSAQTASPGKRTPAVSASPHNGVGSGKTKLTMMTIMTIDQAVEAARRALPKDAPGGYLSLPASGKSTYKVTGYYAHTLPYSELVRVSLDSYTGEVLTYADTRDDTRGGRVEQYFTTVHFGSFGGTGWLGVVVKVLWVVLGIVPALLAVSGLLMYWNRKLRPAWLRRQRALTR